jgi:methyl-accepting chemotaxis protein
MAKTPRLTIRLKIRLLLVICCVGFLAVVAFQINRQSAAIYDAKRFELQNLTAVAISVIAEDYAALKAGTLTKAAAKDNAMARIAKIRYGRGDYFWINDQTHMLMHPVKPELVGRDLATIKDPSGVPVFAVAAQIVRDKQSGFLSYLWPRPGSDQAQPKISYVTGFAPWGWVIGTGVYVDDLDAEIWAATQFALIFAGGVLIMVGAFAVFVSGRISQSLQAMTSAMRRLADGDLATALPAIKGRDELADMAAALTIFRDAMVEADQLRAQQSEADRHAEANSQKVMVSLAERIRTSVGVIVDGLKSLSTSAHASTVQMKRNSEKSSARIAQALAELNVASGDVSTVATAVTDLSASIGQISAQTRRTAQSRAAAMAAGQAAHEVADNLTLATRSIGDISNLISAIASQTNLLALNATIEAARAGEAGRGFAIVASEVKMLAEQTAKATQDINHQVEGIRATTASVVAAISEINGAVDEVSQCTSSIESAVEEQSSATDRINHNVQRAATGTRGVIGGIADLPAMAHEIEDAAGSLSNVMAEFGDQAQMLSNEIERLLKELTDRRSEKRVVMSEDATIIVGSRTVACTIHDLSVSGARITPRTPLAIGEELMLTLANAKRVKAAVMWSANGQCGLGFKGERLDLDDIETRRRAAARAA